MGKKTVKVDLHGTEIEQFNEIKARTGLRADAEVLRHMIRHFSTKTEEMPAQ